MSVEIDSSTNCLVLAPSADASGDGSIDLPLPPLPLTGPDMWAPVQYLDLEGGLSLSHESIEDYLQLIGIDESPLGHLRNVVMLVNKSEVEGLSSISGPSLVHPLLICLLPAPRPPVARPPVAVVSPGIRTGQSRGVLRTNGCSAGLQGVRAWLVQICPVSVSGGVRRSKSDSSEDLAADMVYFSWEVALASTGYMFTG